VETQIGTLSYSKLTLAPDLRPLDLGQRPHIADDLLRLAAIATGTPASAAI